MNALTTTTPADQFRAKAANLLVLAAGMTLHQLLDEFQRLTTVMDENVNIGINGYPELNKIGELASRERNIILGASKSRFGVYFESWDRACDRTSSDYPC